VVQRLQIDAEKNEQAHAGQAGRRKGNRPICQHRGPQMHLGKQGPAARQGRGAN